MLGIKGRMIKKIRCRNMFLWIGFYLQPGILGLLLVLQDSWKVVSIETKWRDEKLRMLRWQRVSSDVWGIVFACCRNWTLDVTMSFVSGIWGEYALSTLKWFRGKMGARCRERDYASDRHSQFWGDIKLSLCEACWMHLIYIQLGFLARNP